MPRHAVAPRMLTRISALALFIFSALPLAQAFAAPDGEMKASAADSLIVDGAPAAASQGIDFAAALPMIAPWLVLLALIALIAWPERLPGVDNAH